jgi:hypothetical protein
MPADGTATLSRHPPSPAIAPTLHFAPRAPIAPRPQLMPWLWCLAVLGLLAWHATMTLQLFGTDNPWKHLGDAEPIVSGRHALHLYHGLLGARAFRATRRLTCFDPANMAGYPKTPIFDSGSRPAELFLMIAGGVYDPAAYKYGVAVCCALVPLFVIVACWGAGLSVAATCLATATSLLVWSSTPCRRALDAGDIDLLLAALAILAHVGLLIRFDKQPGFLTWQGMLLTGCLGWFAHPMVFLLVLPLVLVYYLSTGARHGLTTWHFTLALSELGALVLNGFWLSDWVRHWWLRSPLPSSDGMLLHRTFATLWCAPQWGDHPDRIMYAIVLISAVLGIVILNQSHQRVAARLLGMGAGGLWILAILGISWEPLGQLGTSELMVPALWFAALPAAHAWTQGGRLLTWLTGSPLRGALVVCGLLGAVAWLERDLVDFWSERCSAAPRFTLGLSPDREAIVETLRQTTTPDARILWEDLHCTNETQRWTALLPLLTDRSFIGGLDPNGTIPHSQTGLVDQVLCRRPLTLWSDIELDSYCRRYNIGWIVCRSPESTTRFHAWSGVSEKAQLNDDVPLYLFEVKNAAKTFVIKGQATVLEMDSHHITLANVIPKDGVVVLSLHYQSGMVASPDRIIVESEDDKEDLIPFVRLRLDREASRVTLTWVGR